MQKLQLHIILLLVMLLSLNVHAFFNDDFKLTTTQTEFVAGDTVVLKFSTTSSKTPSLYVSNSFGTTLIEGERADNILSYKIPNNVSSKSGVIHWKLLATTANLQGIIKIVPTKTVSKIQTYLGPPSISAGGKDFSMMVAIPTDEHDNPLVEGTKVAIKHQFQSNQTVDSVHIKNSISYQNIYSPLQTGRILLSSSCLGFNSKEYDISIMPAPPTNFEIKYKRDHDYADGNQITTFFTSKIKDAYDNTISDGTYVEFFIRTKNNTILKTSGTTINGVASAKMIHPSKSDDWSVQAFIEGMAESNRIDISFKSVIKDFDITLSNNNRNITIGPLKSFMNQMIPDGLEVILEVYADDEVLHTQRKSSYEGYVSFKLKPDQLPTGDYKIAIKTAGISKSIAHLKL